VLQLFEESVLCALHLLDRLLISVEHVLLSAKLVLFFEIVDVVSDLRIVQLSLDRRLVLHFVFSTLIAAVVLILLPVSHFQFKPFSIQSSLEYGLLPPCLPLGLLGVLCFLSIV
jgi:hypothetical protein